MKKNPLVSIVVPAYNSEKYISFCLDSLIKQTFCDIEIIVVDDGSSDKTNAIVREYSKSDDRIKLVVGKHDGVNIARGLGIKQAIGKYCMFVDSDDWVALNAVEKLVKYTEEFSVDVIRFNALTSPSNKLKNPFIKPGDDSVEMDGSSARYLLATEYILNNLCFQFYKTTLIKNAKSFNKAISNCEDYLVNIEVYGKVKKVLFISDILYNYRDNQGSTTKSSDVNRIINNLDEQIDVYSMLLKETEDWGFTIEQRKQIAVLSLEKIRRGLFILFKLNYLDKSFFCDTVDRITQKKSFREIRKNVDSKFLKNVIKKMPFFYRVKYSDVLMDLYIGSANNIWRKAFLYRLIHSKQNKKNLKTISKYMRGRLGNQLFQYATLRQIQEENNDGSVLCLNFSKYVYSLGFKNDLRSFRAKYVEVNDVKISVKQKLIIFLHKAIKRTKRLLDADKYKEYRYNFENKKSTKLQKNGLYWKEDGALEIRKSTVANKIAIGHFESEKNFDRIRSQLLDEIQPIEPPLKKNKVLYDIIRKEESVCISIRRGDYVENPVFAKNFNVCNEQYFKEAIKEAKKRVKNPVFVMFSDDIEWCRKNIKIPGEKVYYEDGNDPVWEKLRLMYSCKHFIISNSTFSWWAQYLSRNEKKVVIAPKIWSNYGYDKDIYNTSWILIDNQRIKP